MALLKERGAVAHLVPCTASAEAIVADPRSVVDPGRGPRPGRASDSWPRVAGETLLDMQRADYSDAATQAQSTQLMRFLLAPHLCGAPLNTRQILIDLMQL